MRIGGGHHRMGKLSRTKMVTVTLDQLEYEPLKPLRICDVRWKYSCTLQVGT